MMGNTDSEINLVDYLREAIDEGKRRSTKDEFSLKLICKDRFGNEDGAKYLSKILSECRTISVLNLELQSNRMKDKDIRILMDTVKTLTNLKSFTLDVCANSFTSDILAIFAETLPLLTQLETLSLNIESTKIDKKNTLETFGNKLSECKNLKNLILDEGLTKLSQSLAKCISLQNINFNLGCNGFSQFPGQFISQMIGNGPYQEMFSTLEANLKKHSLISLKYNVW